jgi:hypothetical protein
MIRRAVLLAALVLAWASTAGAECNVWVLWQQHTTAQGAPLLGTFSIEKTFTSEEACEQERARWPSGLRPRLSCLTWPVDPREVRR